MKPDVALIVSFLGIFSTGSTQLLALDSGVDSLVFIEHEGPGKLFNVMIDSISIEGILIGEECARKPTIIFIPGSEPVPLYARLDSIYYPMFPWQILQDKTYNYVIVSKPGIPAIVNVERLNEDYYYLDSINHEPPLTYKKNNNLNFYSMIYAYIISKLSGSSGSIYVMGHSQGARIAAELIAVEGVDKVVVMSADPLGRMATLIDKEYGNVAERSASSVKLYHDILSEAKGDSTYMGDYYSSFLSFSKPTIISLAQAKIPILVMFGGMDKSCPNCYIWPIMEIYNNCISVKEYPYWDHNYFDADGKNNWKMVVEHALNWMRTEE